MAITLLLGATFTTTTAPNPNTLTTTNPYATANISYPPAPFISAAWTSQNQPALFPLGINDGSGEKQLELEFIPSGGSATTYTIVAWTYSRVSGLWVKPKNGLSTSYTGNSRDFIYTPGLDPWFLQVSALSTGTLTINYDGQIARAY